MKSLHNIKLLSEYAMSKLEGVKPFEIRHNDRDYKVGDFIIYSVPDNEKLDKLFKRRIYRIEYITNYCQNPDFVVFTDNLIFIE